MVFDPLPMVFWCPTHGILTPYLWYIAPPPPPLSMVFWPTYPWYIDPLSMVIWPPYPWYFDPSAYLLIRNEGVKIPWGSMFHTGGSIYHGWKLTPESLYHGGQNTIWHRSFLHSSPITGFVTRLTWVPLVEQEQPTFPEHSSSPRFLVGFVLLDL
jgi:hypothetical protein